ncbi:MAG: hypothetical protein ABSA76_07580 [Bacteroidales bacterium]
MKKNLLIISLAVLFISGTAFVCLQQPQKQNVKSEATEHPKIVNAIKELEGAIDYLQKAPSDFGGFKAQAITDSKKAVESLKKALEYRAKADNTKPAKPENTNKK